MMIGASMMVVTMTMMMMLPSNRADRLAEHLSMMLIGANTLCNDDHHHDAILR